MPLPALATGGHYPVDDADITASGEFEVEAWFTRVDGSNAELAFLPAWTPRGTALQLTAGFIRVQDDGERFYRFEPAAKWQFSPIEPGRLAMAAAVELGFDDGSFTDSLVNVPLSYALVDAPMVIHANLGWIRWRGNGNRDRAFLGAGVEWELNPAFDLLAQVYREGADEDPEAQLGLRLGFGDLLDHLDLAAGRALGGDRSWQVTVGLALTF